MTCQKNPDTPTAMTKIPASNEVTPWPVEKSIPAFNMVIHLHPAIQAKLLVLLPWVLALSVAAALGSYAIEAHSNHLTDRTYEQLQKLEEVLPREMPNQSSPKVKYGVKLV